MSKFGALRNDAPELYACISACLEEPAVAEIYGARYENYGAPYWWRDRTRMVEPLTSLLMTDQQTIFDIGEHLRSANAYYEKFRESTSDSCEHALSMSSDLVELVVMKAALVIELFAQLMPETREVFDREGFSVDALIEQRNAFMHVNTSLRLSELEDVKRSARELIGARDSMKTLTPRVLDPAQLIAVNTDRDFAHFQAVAAEVHYELEQRVSVISKLERDALSELHGEI